MPRPLPLAFAISAAALACAHARAQEAVMTGVDTSAEFDMGNPGELPGQERVDPRREAPAEPPAAPEAREWFGGKPWLEWSRVTGDWGGVRTAAEEKGLTVSASYTLDWMGVWSGGLSRSAGTRSVWNINARLDLATLAGLEGGAVFASFDSIEGRGGSSDAGDYGGVSDIASPKNTSQLSELWYEQWLFGKALRLKAGKVDANAEFAFIESAADFTSSPTTAPVTMGPVFPTYPNPATGAVAFWYPSESLHVAGGYFDGSIAEGNPTGRLGPASFFSGEAPFFIGEFGARWKAGLGPGRVLVGGWHSSADFTRFDGSGKSGTSGAYVIAEQRLAAREGAGEDELKGLYAFGQLNFGEESVNGAGTHVQVGVSALGTFPGRDGDSAGIVGNWIDLSDATGTPFPEDEWSAEAFYRFALTPWCRLTPSIQWIGNPSGSDMTDDAVVGKVRVQIVF